MAKKEEKKDERQERRCMGCRLHVWAKLANMCLGAAMIAVAIFGFFDLDIPSDEAILIYSFKVYQM